MQINAVNEVVFLAKYYLLIMLSSILMLNPADLHGQHSRHIDSLQINRDALNFLVLGDWGRMGSKRQRQVAIQMAKTSRNAAIDFIISTGDNFYPNGVESEHDSSWYYSFEEVYNDESLHIPWYTVFGNHDYGGNPQAQISYSTKSSRWKMPSRYYEEIFFVNGDSTNKILLVFIDTTPLINSYYNKTNLAVHGQDTTAQLRWLEKTLISAPADVKWKFVVGHHPIYTAGERRNNQETRDIRRVLEPLFRRARISAYLSGHEHNLQHITSPEGIEQFISGAGSEARRIGVFARRRFARKKCGFITFSVRDGKTAVQVISAHGKLLYAYELTGD